MRGQGAAVCSLLLAACAQVPEPSIDELLDRLVRALQDGRVEEAVELAARARQRDPQHVAAAQLSATVAELTWRDDDAVKELMVALRHGRVDGRTPREAALRGRLGDVLFQAGRYGESVEPLRAGAAAQDGERRRAFAAVAATLPAVRKADGPLVSEHPLLPGDMPEFACGNAGRQRPFVIDTGTSMTTVAASFAVELGVKDRQAAGMASDSSGRELPIEIGVLTQFVIGDLALGAVPVLVVDDAALQLRDLFGGAERVPRGVVGLDLLGTCRLTLDPERQSIVLEVPRGLPVEQSVQCVRVEGRCLVPVFVEDVRMWFVLDTGASHSSLSETGLARLRGGAERAVASFPRRHYKVGGAGIAVREVRDLVIRCSRARFLGVTLPVLPRGAGGMFPVHGVLGVDLLGRCRVTLDRGRARLTALP